jgi:hypothetical protein
MHRRFVIISPLLEKMRKQQFQNLQLSVSLREIVIKLYFSNNFT